MIAEWKGRNDGLVAHVFFKGSPNFALSVFAFAVEGYDSNRAIAMLYLSSNSFTDGSSTAP
jgi:hypothetical protein